MKKSHIFLSLCVTLSPLLPACDDDGGGDAAPDTVPDTAPDTAPDTVPDAAQLSPDRGVDTVADMGAPDAASPDMGAPPEGACWDDLAPGESEIFYDGFPGGLGNGTEGISFGADGRLYVTGQSTVWVFEADGEAPSVHVELPTALGLAPHDGGLVVASIGESNAPEDIDGAVYFISEGGEITQWTDTIASPNFVTMMPDGSALISDDFDTRVWRVAPAGEVTEAIVGIASPNGMAYAPDGSALYVASTFSPDGEITRIPVDEGGVPQADGWTRVAELGAGATADGLAVGASGAIYVAANIRNELVRVPPDGGEWAVFAADLGTPASLAFGAGEGFDPCSVYVTQLFGTAVLRVAIGEPGAPLLPFQ